MSTPGLQLISRIVRGRPEFQTANRWGITQDDFVTQEEIGLWRHIVGLNQMVGSHGSIPGVNSIREAYPHFILCDDESMSTEMLCKQVRDRRLITQLKIAAQEAIENAEIGPMEAAAEMQRRSSLIIELGADRNTDVQVGSAFDEIVHDYTLAEAGVVTTARATWPWPSLQEVTGGIQEDDYIVLYGRPKSMKSWVLCFLIAHLFWMDKKVLIYTKEMTPKNIYKRIAACLAAIPYQEFRGARLEREEKLRLLQAYDEVKTKSDALVCLSGRDVPFGGDTVAWYRAKAEHYKPDVGAIDGFALMSASGGRQNAEWARVMSISREISMMRLSLQLPIVATTHANRKAAQHSKAELDEISNSDAIGQDATIAMRVINEKGKPTIALVVGGSREFHLHGVRIGGVPATDFEEKEKMTEKEINKAQEGDVGDADQPDAHSKPRRTPRTSKGNEDQQVEKLLDQQLKSI